MLANYLLTFSLNVCALFSFFFVLGSLDVSLLARWPFPWYSLSCTELVQRKKNGGGGGTVKYVDDYEKVPDQQKEVINNYFKRTT